MSDPADDPFAWEHATIDGKYEVDAVVGRGGFGVVYGARHLGFGEKVAVKCLKIPQTLSSDERSQFQQSFLAEGRLLHQLSRATAGIVQALDVGTAVSPNGTWTPFLVLEWLEGRSLEQDFAGRRKDGVPGRTLRESIELMDSAVRALEVAHSQGIAHRDIKPANLFITEIGGRTTLKVLDFGIAKVVSDSESMTKAFEATGASLQAFTARYGSPEQFSRRYGSTGPWTDVFALTLVLIEMVIGRSPLDGSDAAQLFISAADTLHRPTLRTHGVETSDAIEAVLKTALSVDPKERYPSAGPFWDALIAAVEASGEAGNIAGRSRSPSLPLFSSTSATRVEGPAVEIVPAGDAPARTELTSSTPAQRGPAQPPTAQGSRRVALITAGVLSLVSVIIVLLFHAKSSGPTDGASSPANSAVASNSLALTGGSAPERPPVPAASAPGAPSVASSASAAPAAGGTNAATRALPGFPSRDIPAGTVEDSGAWLDKFSVLEREGGAGLNLADAFARCADVGKALCSESQWRRACASFPEVAQAASWTESLEDGQSVVRGGATCSTRKLVSEDDRDPARVGLCCDRAIAMTTTTLQKQFLASVGNVLIKVEKALNQRNIDGFLELSDDKISLNQKPSDKASLRNLLTQSFSASQDLVVVNDICDISVEGKRTFKKVHRKKVPVTETTGWSAVCRQTRHRDGKAFSAKSTYDFTATSKIRAIADAESRGPE